MMLTKNIKKRHLRINLNILDFKAITKTNLLISLKYSNKLCKWEETKKILDILLLKTKTIKMKKVLYMFLQGFYLLERSI